MAPRKGTIKISREDLAVLAAFEPERLEGTPIENPPVIARWDNCTDQPVVRQRYVKDDHDGIDGESALSKAPSAIAG
jgi:hypothetical protein